VLSFSYAELIQGIPGTGTREGGLKVVIVFVLLNKNAHDILCNNKYSMHGRIRI